MMLYWGNSGSPFNYLKMDDATCDDEDETKGTDVIFKNMEKRFADTGVFTEGVSLPDATSALKAVVPTLPVSPPIDEHSDPKSLPMCDKGP